MNGTFTLYLDQYGNRFVAMTVKELAAKVGGGRVTKMYQDKRDGRTVHIGYVIGRHWLSAYRPFEQAA